MSFNSSEFRRMVQEHKDFERRYENFLYTFLLEMGMRCLGKTKQLTPRDKGAGGGLVGSWELSAVYRNGDDLLIDIFNPLEYASFVEDGHMQRERFLPIKYLEDSKTSQAYLNKLREKYGSDMKGVMLKDKFIPGHHMARIALNQIEKELPKRYNKMFEQFLATLEAR